MKLIVAIIFYTALFGSVELVARLADIKPELSRKFVHITVGISAAFLPFFVSFREIQLLSLLFIPVMLLSKKLNIFGSIHNVRRSTYGEIYFPFAIFIAATLFPDKITYTFGLLVMALGDGLAGVIGQKYGKKTYRLWASKKSYVGSGVLFIVTALLSIICLSVAGMPGLFPIIWSLLIAGILTLTEAYLAYGLDNLILPLLACFLFSVIN